MTTSNVNLAQYENYVNEVISIQISDAPWIGNPDYGRENIEPITECDFCGKQLFAEPVLVEDEWIDTDEKGLVCRSCFGGRYFDDIKEN